MESKALVNTKFRCAPDINVPSEGRAVSAHLCVNGHPPTQNQCPSQHKGGFCCSRSQGMPLTADLELM